MAIKTDKNNFVIGILGGMGSYATVDFFRRIVDAFPAEKEWDRPRIIIDNYCTMPSRVRAILYGEQTEELVEMMSESVTNMINAGANRIVFACNTSHVFLPLVAERVKGFSMQSLNIIDLCGKVLNSQHIHRVGLMATEGTIDTHIYEDILRKYDVSVDAPNNQQYVELREFIEAVKQNNIDKSVMVKFSNFVNGFVEDTVVLGCTELPILYRKCIDDGLISMGGEHKYIVDPLQCVIDELVKEYKEFDDER